MKRDKLDAAKPVEGKSVSDKELNELVSMLRSVPHDHEHHGHHDRHHGSKSGNHHR